MPNTQKYICIPKFSPHRNPYNNFSHREEPLQMKTTTPKRWEGQLAEHGDYSIITNCRTNIAAIFRWPFGIFRSISKCVFIYLFHALSRNPLVGKHCIKHRHHQYIRL